MKTTRYLLLPSTYIGVQSACGETSVSPDKIMIPMSILLTGIVILPATSEQKTQVE